MAQVVNLSRVFGLERKVVFPSQSNAVILPPISRNLRFFEPIFVSLGGSKNRDSTEQPKETSKSKNKRFNSPSCIHLPHPAEKKKAA